MVLFNRSTLLVSFLALATNVSAAPELDLDSYAALIKSNKNGMIKFFQPWCGHCTSMKPAYDAVSAASPPSVVLADVNCSEQKELCEEAGVTGYPTIKVLKDGEITDYSGGRTEEDLTKYVETELSTRCDIADVAKTCSVKAAPYVDKWRSKDEAAVKKELGRLEAMSGKSMNRELKVWLRERIVVLQQISPAATESPEL